MHCNLSYKLLLHTYKEYILEEGSTICAAVSYLL